MRFFLTILILFVSHETQAQMVSAPMSFTDTVVFERSRLWLPCSYGQCMIDLGGRGSIIKSMDEKSIVSKIKTVQIKTLQGLKNCDMIRTNAVVLAGKEFSDREFMVCNWMLEQNSPMLGLDYFYNQIFELDFLNQKFSWLSEIENNKNTVPLVSVDGWPVFQAKIGEQNVATMLDTGCPVTIIDAGFYQKNADMFKTDSEGNVFIMHAISVSEVDLPAGKVLIKDIKATFGKQAPEIMIGMNHLSSARWQIDLKNRLLNVFR